MAVAWVKGVGGGGGGGGGGAGTIEGRAALAVRVV